ncbi:hypothetical protein DV738_g1990, partial [Chaetothyriales sp. CBS 135597]
MSGSPRFVPPEGVVLPMLAKGGSALIYQSSSQPKEVLKVPLKLDTTGCSIETTEFAQEDEEFSRQCLKREREIYTLLPPHIGVLTPIEISATAIRFPFLQNGDLRTYLQVHGSRISMSTREQWVRAAVESISFVHSFGILHCDLSARNFLVADDLTLKLCDFAGSTLPGDHSAPLVSEEVRYRKIEGIAASTQSTQTELFAIGSLIYEIITGHPPYDDLSDEDVEERYGKQDLPPLENVQYAHIIQKCWTSGYENAEAVAKDIQPKNWNLYRGIDTPWHAWNYMGIVNINTSPRCLIFDTPKSNHERALMMVSTPAPASAIRASLRDHRQHTGSPHTPTRFVPSTFSSPGSTLRQEEDAVIIELDPRHLKAGFEGESGPQCAITFGPDGARRVGDYQQWLPDYRPRTTAKFTTEAARRELWRNDLADFDLGLMEDRLERAVREAYNKYLLTDPGTARLVLVLPSLVPLPVLSSMLTVLFERWKFPSITLLPSPTMCTIAAGLRSALVVDIGWEETVVTPVYECRELTSRRSIRGMKRLVGAMKEKLQALAGQQQTVGGYGHSLRLDFDFVEDFVHRLAFCKGDAGSPKHELSRRTQRLAIDPDPDGQGSASDRFSFDWPCHGSTESITLEKDAISDVVEGAFFGEINDSDSDSDAALYDDQEEPLDHLVYQTLLRLPPDIRGTCMARITFTGHGHRILGVNKRIIHDLNALLRKHGWNAVRGTKLKPSRKGLAEVAQARAAPADYKHNIDRAPDGRDLVTPKLAKQKARGPQPGPQGVLRIVDTLGPWAGASLLTSLKVRGIVDIDRDRFLSHGLAGASKDHDASVVPQQRPANFSVATSSKSSDKTSWTLAGWA